MAGQGKGAVVTSAERLAIIEKQRQALAYRLAGLTLDVIATRLGYASESGARKAIETALRRTLQEPADQVRELELHRLDRMLSAIWTRVTAGDFDAIDRALKIMARRAKLLGLDAATTIDLTVYVEALARASGRDVAEALAEVDGILHDGRHHAPTR